jgi:hypothetical protein
LGENAIDGDRLKRITGLVNPRKAVRRGNFDFAAAIIDGPELAGVILKTERAAFLHLDDRVRLRENLNHYLRSATEGVVGNGPLPTSPDGKANIRREVRVPEAREMATRESA